jgi:hypothetical protein
MRGILRSENCFGAADPLHIDTGDGNLQYLRDIGECTNQPLVRMASPNLGRRQAKRVHVHHRIGCGDLFLGHLLRLET